MTNMLRYENLTYQLNGLFMDTYNMLQAGWPEGVYHEGVVELAKQRDIPVETKPRKMLVHREKEIHLFEADVIAFDLIVLEFKVLPHSDFAPGHFAQIMGYMKCWGKDLGLLVNFGGMRVKFQRVVWDEPPLKVNINLEALQGKWYVAAKTEIDGFQDVILDIGKQYGLGYSDTIYRSIAEIEFVSSGFDCQAKLFIPAVVEGKIIGGVESQYLLLNGRYLLSVRALVEYPTRYDFAQMKTFLRSLGLKVGLIVNFGKKELQIFGVNSE